MNLIGAKTQMQFQDMLAHQTNAPRQYKKYIQRIDEMERILRFLMTEVGKYDFMYYKDRVDQFLEVAHTYKLDDMEAALKQTYKQFVDFKANNAALVAEKNAAVEEKCVVEVSLKSFGNVTRAGDLGESLLGGNDKSAFAAGDGMTFSNIAGTIAEEDQQRFARFLFRMSRGNTFTNFAAIEEPLIDPKTGAKQKKSVFVVFFQDVRGPTESVLHSKIVKACAQFGVNTYAWPFSAQDAAKRLRDLTDLVKDKETAQKAFEGYIVSESARLLSQTRSGNSLIEDWRLACIKEKSIYAVLNQCTGESTLRINVWYPEADEENIRQLLVANSNSEGAAYLISDKTRSMKKAPTYFRSNEFVAPFQDLVNTYGVPRYKEASPVPFTMVTFPFIFGIMYGDVGHGSMMFLFAIWACLNAEKLRYSVPGLYGARYMVLMMGFFATYAGFMYNDFFSLGMNLFGTKFETTASETDPIQNYTPTYDVTNSGGEGPVPIGIDPAWAGAQNELLFLNGLKMKMAVLFGVAQMSVGVLLKWCNAFSEGNKTDFFCECIPMMIFMMCFFGYMDFMIMYKWVNVIPTPPSLINSLIAMAMFQDDPNPLFPGSPAFASKLMCCALVSVPWLLIPKTVVMYIESKKHAAHALAHPKLDGQEEEDEHPEFAEEAIEQIIFTIEYVLGTVSHTASYLRMWALSLAHQQLSLVFFQKTLVGAISSGNPVFVFLGFAAWLAVTFAVLLCMDSLECFLHTLRLHWVEFQSKFFHADGHLFVPYNHKALLSAQQD
jgi:V-type H+-transporting ATPase subunit a